MKFKSYLLILTFLMVTSCSVPVDQPPPPTAIPTDTPLPVLVSPSTFAPTPALSAVETPSLAPSFCDDPRGRELITSFTNAITTKDGQLLSSLVSLIKGMDVRFFRDGNIINYDIEHAKYVFETTFQADWGLSYGSGEPTLGSFQEIVLPSLQQVFTPSAVLLCNKIKTGGATYQPIWPYQNMNFYSVHFPGTDPNGGLDWQTWVVGIENIADKYFVAALVHFVWEP